MKTTDTHAAERAMTAIELQSVAALLNVIAELSDVLREENEMLRQGLPATVSLLTERKTELAEEYSNLWQSMLRSPGRETTGAALLTNGLLNVAQELDELARENARRLEAAADATRRRIAAIMSAIRESDGDSRPYTASAQKIATHFIPGNKRYEA